MLPDPPAVIPMPVTITLTAIVEVALNWANWLLLIICPIPVDEFNMPIITDPAGESVSALAVTLLDLVEKNEIKLFEIVFDEAPETCTPMIWAFGPVDSSEILVIRLFVMETAALE
jgi:hypothetical protein